MSIADMATANARSIAGIAEKPMKEFTVTGTLTLSGVVFYVRAETLEGALGRLALGDYDSYDTDMAESVNHRVDLPSIEENV